ncbi:hypothetical protein COU78_06980 [Candidatus Peregrinibacteria bacterium CG10_big_fil_rev_8_21_14_0_10_49_24]|nr:MAG: hypothetical protein COV83_05850 [Candidatus Peregrinibacteria bacterium CG11_big_fil_rev_8_21_14_0_20_49_14]PIR50346.1 MAG: hypothetical protein COU78_06980 [Candidatus Peregrinibacteria bacterium CG10_big_fil_rev_8_21_14_0_10_49_24]PJA67774.1 MAG: hypothetical protein CO157_02800 [Candidatus Peregrinibacteria bacterium CG_4_9_14_3_um_filter_49_12]
MRSISLLSLTFALLFSASPAAAYFRALPLEEEAVASSVREPMLATTVKLWPGWVGMPHWMNAMGALQSLPPTIVRTGTQSTENWPLWIDQPNWLK